MLPALI
jgi:hypothetical protein